MSFLPPSLFSELQNSLVKDQFFSLMRISKVGAGSITALSLVAKDRDILL